VHPTSWRPGGVTGFREIATLVKAHRNEAVIIWGMEQTNMILLFKLLIVLALLLLLLGAFGVVVLPIRSILLLRMTPLCSGDDGA
jgi:hypothetical protein